jgi:D-sedoheptulose 7-phosphate isomerase
MGAEIVKSGTRDLCQRIVRELEESLRVKQQVVQEQVGVVDEIARLLVDALGRGRKVVLFGNGGSAADAQHIAGELVSKFRQDRRALPAIALTTDTSILTSIANDYGYETVFSRQVEALGQEGDVAVSISTSGNSRNVIKGVIAARAKGMMTIGFTGEHGGELKKCVDVCFCAPSQSTPRIQETHIVVAHIICGLIEEELCRGGDCHEAA